MERIGNGFARNYNLSILNMTDNLLTQIDSVAFAHNQNLCVLDLSNNKIGEKVPKGDTEAMHEFRQELMLNIPPSLLMLDLSGNPCAISHNDKVTNALINYRKPFVVGLPNLEKLDGVDVL